MHEYLRVIRVLNFLKEWIKIRRSELEQVIDDSELSNYVRGKLDMLDELEKIVNNYETELKDDIERIIYMLRSLVGDLDER